MTTLDELFVPTPEIDPVCLLHGIARSKHEHGRCLYCCICFTELEPETCAKDASGQKYDVCIPCAENEGWGVE